MRRSSARIFAISTAGSKGFAMKSSPPMSTAMTMFMFSAALDTKSTGTAEILRISLHQW